MELVIGANSEIAWFIKLHSGIKEFQRVEQNMDE